MNARHNSLFWVVGSAIALLLILFGALELPLSRAFLPIEPVAKTDTTLLLEQGVPWYQSVVVTDDAFRSGVVFYSGDEELSGRRFLVTVRDKDGVVLSSQHAMRVAYEPDATVRYTALLKWFSVPAGTPVIVEVALLDGPPVLLKVSSGDVDSYSHGKLSVGDTAWDEVDMGLLWVSPVVISEFAQFGVTSGVVFGLALLVIFFVVPVSWQSALLVVLLIVSTPLALGGYWFSDGPLGIADWDYYFSLHHAYRHIALYWGEFPTWNPYTCGGTAGLGDPEFPGFTFTYLLEFLFDIPTGVRLAIYLSVATTAV